MGAPPVLTSHRRFGLTPQWFAADCVEASFHVTARLCRRRTGHSPLHLLTKLVSCQRRGLKGRAWVALRCSACSQKTFNVIRRLVQIADPFPASDSDPGCKSRENRNDPLAKQTAGVTECYKIMYRPCDRSLLQSCSALQSALHVDTAPESASLSHRAH